MVFSFVMFQLICFEMESARVLKTVTVARPDVYLETRRVPPSRSGANPGFPIGGGANVNVGAPAYYFTQFYPKTARK